MIESVVVKNLKVIPDERGWLMEILRCDDEIFSKFGQAYITTAYPNVVKGWHYHKLQDDHFCVLKGMAKVVLYDGREKSRTNGELNEFFMGEKNPMVLRIPKLVYHGFKAVGTETAYVLNIPTMPYNKEKPDEYRIPADSKEIPYDWSLKRK